MSISLDGMQRESALRIAAFEAMLTHLDLDPAPEEAPMVFSELKSALMACSQCRTPARCGAWRQSGEAGTPEFCGATQAFRNLLIATEATRIRAA